MTIDQFCDTLSTSEKIILMERLWSDLSENPKQLESPSWHGEVVAERIEAVREGRTEFVEWDDAKRRLRERLE